MAIVWVRVAESCSSSEDVLPACKTFVTIALGLGQKSGRPVLCCQTEAALRAAQAVNRLEDADEALDCEGRVVLDCRRAKAWSRPVLPGKLSLVSFSPSDDASEGNCEE
jgi:hypothetical protein